MIERAAAARERKSGRALREILADGFRAWRCAKLTPKDALAWDVASLPSSPPMWPATAG